VVCFDSFVVFQPFGVFHKPIVERVLFLPQANKESRLEFTFVLGKGDQQKKKNFLCGKKFLRREAKTQHQRNQTTANQLA